MMMTHEVALSTTKIGKTFLCEKTSFELVSAFTSA